MLVLSGVSTLSDIETMPFRLSYVYPSVADITIFLTHLAAPGRHSSS